MIEKNNIPFGPVSGDNLFFAYLKKTGWVLLSIFIVSLALFLILSGSAVSSAMYGDINQDGEINVQDVVLTMRHVLGLQELNSIQRMAADVNNDKTIDVADVTLIMRKSLAIIEKFPGLSSSEFSLVKEDGFSVHEGLLPGYKMVIVSLVINDPENYRVYIAEKELSFSSLDSNSVKPFFYGEIKEEDAKIENVKVKSKK